MTLCLARAADAAACRSIYAQYIDTAITFETALPSEQEFAARIAVCGETYPWLVARQQERVVAYAYAHRAQERAAYDWNAELSVYVAREACGQGLGTTLYTALVELLRRQGVRNVYGVVVTPNAASEALHEKLGFRRLGVYRKTGYKDGAWRDVVWFEKAIGSFETVPEPLVPIGALENVQKLLADMTRESV